VKIATYKALSQTMLVAGNLSIVASLGLWFSGRLTGNLARQNDGLFVGLWVPSLFSLADRLATLTVDKVEELRYGETTENLESRRTLETRADVDAGAMSVQSPRPLSHTRT
jgi:hypothetical protein